MNATHYLITGGAGFIGSHIAEALLKRGESVRIFDNFLSGQQANIDALKSLPGNLQLVSGDIRDKEALQRAVQNVEVVFHQAAIASVPRSIADPALTLEVNINGTQNVLLAARNASVRRVVFASSSAVYGNAPVQPKSEELPSEPMSPYALHKLTGELLCRLFTDIYGLETVALRYFNVFGPRQDPASEYSAVIPRFLTALMKRQRPIVFGDGQQTRDFVYVENVVEANLLAATAEGAIGTAINVGSGERLSLNEVLRIAGELLHTRITTEYHEPRPGDVRDSLADIRKARHLLGYEPTISFREGLQRTLQALS